MKKEEMILKFMQEKEYVPMKQKEMAQILCVPKEKIKEFKEVLSKLESEYKIEKNKKGKYKLIDGKYKKGTFRANPKGFGFVKLENEENEIYIPKEFTNNALNEDIVLIEVIKERKQRGKTRSKNYKSIKTSKRYSSRCFSKQ